MIKPTIRILSLTALVAFSAFANAEKAPDAVNAIVDDLKSWGMDSTLISAV